MNEIIETARKAGVVVGTNVGSPEQAKMWKDKGVQFMTFVVNGVIYRSLKGMVKSIRSA